MSKSKKKKKPEDNIWAIATYTHKQFRAGVMTDSQVGEYLIEEMRIMAGVPQEMVRHSLRALWKPSRRTPGGAKYLRATVESWRGFVAATWASVLRKKRKGVAVQGEMKL